MSKIVNRGYVNSDTKEFNENSLAKLIGAGRDLHYLLNNNYKIKGASAFVGNHYLLSERQRLSLVRGISSDKDVELRRDKEIKEGLEGKIVNIDGFNTIITLEVALSNSILIKCMDGTIRDLAGLRGTYKIIDKTKVAVNLLFKALDERGVKKVNIYLDAPVSNSGRLKEFILDLSKEYNAKITVEVINDVDRVLEGLDFVISSDAIILNKCKSWINFNRCIIEKNLQNYWHVDLLEVIL